jgi:hypothetical protein
LIADHKALVDQEKAAKPYIVPKNSITSPSTWQENADFFGQRPALSSDGINRPRLVMSPRDQPAHGLQRSRRGGAEFEARLHIRATGRRRAALTLSSNASTSTSRLGSVEALDREARRLGVTRQALVKLWIAERLEKAA